MTRVPNKVNWGVFASYRMFMLATVAAADSASTVRKNYNVFKYLVKRNTCYVHLYAIYTQTRTLCVLQYVYTHTLWKLLG